MITEVKNMGSRDIERALVTGRKFSRDSARYLAARVLSIKNIDTPIESAYNNVELKALTDSLAALRADLGLKDQ